MNGRLHLGHAFSLTKAEFAACFKRLRGYNVLFPFGFHCTGMPIQAAANKLKAEISKFGNPPKFPEKEAEMTTSASVALDQEVAALAKKGKGKKTKVVAKSAGTTYQWHSLEKMGIPKTEIAAFADAQKWLDYFPPYGKQDLEIFGTSIDFRRSFITTDANPFYDSFVRWQFHRLKEKNKISFGKRANVYSVRDGQVCADHDRSSGEGVGPQEYVLIKLQLVQPYPEKIAKVVVDATKKIFLAPATLRPETMYGQTNCYVLPDGDYGLFELANGEIFIMSQRAATGFAHQGAFDPNFQPYFKKLGVPESLVNIKGWDLLGAAIKAPMQTKYDKVYVLPLETISMTKGTGVVTSVPSDAPDDWIALYEMKHDQKVRAKYPAITDDMVLPYDVIPVIRITVPADEKKEGWASDVSAEYWCEKLEITSQKDKAKLTQAKAETYLHGFNNGVMIIGPYEGMKVSEAKLRVKEDMVKSKDAVLYFEPESQVMSRSGEECIVAHTDQWYLKYGEDEWRKAVEAHVDTVFEAYNAENLARFKYTLGWMKEWACSRLFGLGTKIPWDPTWVIESLSDSTIYMAYYAVSHFLQGPDNLDGTTPKDTLSVPTEALTDEVWDYIFLTPEETKPPATLSDDLKKAVMKMRREFRYWYPMDLRVSGKDLIGNHLTMCLYNHAAIWENEPEMWPKSMYCNGFVLLDNEKMSKGTGNFLMLEEACALYTTDAVRFALADAGDTLEDANFSQKRADAAISMLYVEEEFARKVCLEKKIGDADLRGEEEGSVFMDRAFANELHKLFNETTQCFEQMRWRDGIIAGCSSLQIARDNYREWCYKTHIPMRYDLARKFVEIQALLIAPICPHYAEHVWTTILQKHSLGLGAKGPGTLRDPTGFWADTLPVDKSLSRALTFLQKSARHLRLDCMKDAKSKKNLNSAYIYVTPTYPDWKIATLAFMRSLAPEDSLPPKKDVLAALKAHPESPCTTTFKAQTKAIMQFASFMHDYADEIGLDALDDTLPFDQTDVLLESKTYLENSLLPNAKLSIDIFDLSKNDASPGPDKKKTLADPGKPSIFIFSTT